MSRWLLGVVIVVAAIFVGYHYLWQADYATRRAQEAAGPLGQSGLTAQQAAQQAALAAQQAALAARQAANAAQQAAENVSGAAQTAAAQAQSGATAADGSIAIGQVNENVAVSGDIINTPIQSIKSQFGMRGVDCASIGIVTSETDCLDYDRIIANLKKGIVALSAPEAMKFSSVETVKLVVSAHVDEVELQKQLAAPGSTVEIQRGVGVTHRMAARLESPFFKIDPAGSVSKMLSPLAPTEWTWSIIPVRPDKRASITARLFALVQLDADKIEEVDIETFSKTIVLQVSWFDQAVLLMQMIQPIYAVPAGVVAGLWGLFVYFRRKDDPKLATSKTSTAKE